MEDIFTIISQDLEVAEKAIEKDDFNLISFAGNRIMMNLLVTDEIELMLLGYMIRDLSGELRFIRANRRDAFDGAKQESIAYIIELEALVADKKSDPKIYWGKFSENEMKIRTHMLSQIESSIYTEQSEFAGEYSTKLLDIFYSVKNSITHSKNLMLAMMPNELSRNFNEHGGTEALVIYLVFKAFYEYYTYFDAERQISKERRGEKLAEAKLVRYIENIYKLKSSLSNINDLYEKSNEIIEVLGREAKKSYLLYKLPSEPAEIEHELELPEEAKQKIGETIMQSLQNRKRGEDSRLKRS
jgi:hypothetical protein